MGTRAKYVIMAQSAIILAMSSVAIYGVGTYPEKVDTLIRNTLYEIPDDTYGVELFEASLQYDGVVPSTYLKGRDILVNSFDRHVETRGDFGPWKKLVLAEDYMTVSTAPASPATEVDVRLFDGYVRTKNAMRAADGSAIIFWELVPDNGASKHPTVLLIPGSGNQGAMDLIGEPSPISEYYYQDEMAVRLADSGYAVYVPELRGYGELAVYTDSCDNKRKFNERSRQTGCYGLILENQLDMVGVDINIYRVNDATQVLKHIISLDYVDVNNVATGGLSLGSEIGRAISAYNPSVIKATFAASGIASVLHAPPSYQASVPGALLCCDTNELAATIAPRPLYSSVGRAESELFGWEAETGHSADFLRRVYSMLGAEGNFTYVAHDGNHEYHVPSVMEFLDRHLKQRA